MFREAAADQSRFSQLVAGQARDIIGVQFGHMKSGKCLADDAGFALLPVILSRNSCRSQLAQRRRSFLEFVQFFRVGHSGRVAGCSLTRRQLQQRSAGFFRQCPESLDKRFKIFRGCDLAGARQGSLSCS